MDTRQLYFAQRYWTITEGQGLGPPTTGNNWSPCNAWVDPDHYLHLAITQDTSGAWWCGEVDTTETIGFGEVALTVKQFSADLDPNVVLGMFTDDDDHPGANQGNSELDIELAHFSSSGNANFRAPAVFGPNAPPTFFTFDATKGDGLHTIAWCQPGYEPALRVWQPGLPGGVLLASANGVDPIQEWDAPTYQQPGLATKARINLWLKGSQPPSNGQGVDVVVKAFADRPFPRSALL